MLRVGVMVSGGGTNLQAILDAVDAGEITNAEIAVVISNNPHIDLSPAHNINNRQSFNFFKSVRQKNVYFQITTSVFYFFFLFRIRSAIIIIA